MHNLICFVRCDVKGKTGRGYYGCAMAYETSLAVDIFVLF